MPIAAEPIAGIKGRLINLGPRPAEAILVWPARRSGSLDGGWKASGPDGSPEKGQEILSEALGRTTALPTKGLVVAERGGLAVSCLNCSRTVSQSAGRKLQLGTLTTLGSRLECPITIQLGNDWSFGRPVIIAHLDNCTGFPTGPHVSWRMHSIHGHHGDLS